MNNKGFYLTAVILLLLGASLFFLPESHDTNEQPPSVLLADALDNARFVTIDQTADRIVNEDPQLLLIDVRDSASFRAFSLPGAVNIPLADILRPENLQIIDSHGKIIVFYSNDEVYSGQAWMVCRRAGINNLFILRGGMNAWFKTIVKAEKPAETESSDAFDLYSFRLGVRQHLYGGVSETVPEKKVEAVKTIKPEPVKIQPVQRERVVEGGC